MKRVIKMLMVFILVFSIFCASFVFQSSAADQSKIKSDLQSIMRNMAPGEKTTVYLYVKSAFKTDPAGLKQVERMTLERLGLTSVPKDIEGQREYNRVNAEILNELMNKYAVELAELLGVPEEDQIHTSILPVWNLTVEQIYLASDQDCVKYMQGHEIDFDHEEGEPSLEDQTPDPLIDCIAGTYEIDDKSEISLEYRIPVDNGVVTLFYAESVPFAEEKVYHRLNKYTMYRYSYPEPMLYIADEDRLIELYYAYKTGYVSGGEMDRLARYMQASVYFAGDVNLDGKLDIRDVTSLQRKLAYESIDPDSVSYYVGNVDDDWSLGINDATVIQRYLAEFDMTFG